MLYMVYNKHFTAFFPGVPRWAGTRRNIHSLTVCTWEVLLQSLQLRYLCFWNCEPMVPLKYKCIFSMILNSGTLVLWMLS